MRRGRQGEVSGRCAELPNRKLPYHPYQALAPVPEVRVCEEAKAVL